MSSLVKFAYFVLLPVKKTKQNMTSFLFRSINNKTIIRFGFCDIHHKVPVGVISLSLPLQIIIPNSTSIILDITQPSSNNCL